MRTVVDVSPDPAIPPPAGLPDSSVDRINYQDDPWTLASNCWMVLYHASEHLNRHDGFDLDAQELLLQCCETFTSIQMFLTDAAELAGAR